VHKVSSGFDLFEGVLETFAEAGNGSVPEVFRTQGFSIINPNRDRGVRQRVNIEAKRRAAYAQLLASAPAAPRVRVDRKKARYWAEKAVRANGIANVNVDDEG